MTYIPNNLRQQINERARGRCEYCQTPQIIVVEMEIDHIVPEAAGGLTVLENLCLACIGCNGFKLNFRTGEDQTTGEQVSLYNPRTQEWHDQFA
jgi:5-methylcytosine-specific restriction endonuclease McrA